MRAKLSLAVAATWIISGLLPASPAGSAEAGLMAVAQSATPPASTPSIRARAAIEAEIRRIAASIDGETGVYAVHLETGATVGVNSTDSFPMASTFKIAVAGTVLAQVDAGRLSLDQLVPVDPDLEVSSEGITEVFPFPGLSVSIHNLIDTMLVRSDNSATNVLSHLVGGPTAVTAWVRGLGIEHMRIDGDTKDIVARFFGVLLPSGLSLDAAVAANPKLLEMSKNPSPAFDDDPRDTASPESMVLLLSRIAQGHVLSPSSTEVLLGAMKRDVTGRDRLRGMLPPGTAVADKTGTIGGTINDVGFIELPAGLGRVAIAVYIKKSASSQRERTIAQIARSVYDYMLVAAAARPAVTPPQR
jgi:beta-lactamase class A